ncbi:MAG: PIG-L family deacetylase [Chloroflexi bacterium]|nr:PIG-L family deacetylase [Chloroflexota bacterium]
MTTGAQDYPAGELARSAIVFSPHFDDETLGCGGLIIRKKRAGAAVKIVFMTDGSQSHPHLMPAEKLSAIRTDEGYAAGRALGLESEDIIPLSFPEKRLGDHVETAIARVRSILAEHQPEEVYLPYAGEPLLWSADHRMTTHIVHRALADSSSPMSVFEYPIWCWYSLPWIDPSADGWKTRLIILRNSLGTAFGLRLAGDFRCAVNVGDVLVQKRRALEAHRSQMTPLIENAGWPTLGDVSNGQFLACFFGQREFFRAVRRSA